MEIEGLNVYRTKVVLRNFITSDGFRSVREALIYIEFINHLGRGSMILSRLIITPIFPTLPIQIMFYI